VQQRVVVVVDVEAEDDTDGVDGAKSFFCPSFWSYDVFVSHRYFILLFFPQDKKRNKKKERKKGRRRRKHTHAHTV
jgi:hypothetical protein